MRNYSRVPYERASYPEGVIKTYLPLEKESVIVLLS